MRKKLLASLLMLAVFITSIGVPGTTAEAASTTSSYKEETLLLSGVMEGFTLAKLKSTKTVNRQQFAKMLVNASSYQGQVQTSLKTSLYKDVSYKNSYAGYIKLAANEGWMSATVSGKFKPTAKITTKDAAKAVLALLGYTNTDFSGNVTSARMAKFNALDLNDNVEKTKDQSLTFKDCTNIFYNLLTAKMKNTGAVYGVATFNLALDSDGEISYLSLLKTSLDGPVLLTSSLASVLPFSTKNAAVYRNEAPSTVSAINPYDVVYYSKTLNTVWAYNTKVSGVLSAVTPSRSAPSAITIGDESYTLGTKDMTYAFSSLGNFRLNSAVTLFLGMDDKVVAALGSADYEIDSYGVVVSTGVYIGSASDSDTNNRYLTLVTANGSTGTYYFNSADLSISVGNLVHVSYANGEQKLERITSSYTKLTNSYVTASTNKIGSYKVAGDATIVDTKDSNYKVVTLDMIDGATLTYDSVLYYEFNNAGEISALILKGVTSDNYTYGVITTVMGSASGINTYTYMTNGAIKTISSTLAGGTPELWTGLRISTYYDISGNPSMVNFAKLASSTVTSITSGKIASADWTKTIASGASVYYRDSQGNFHTTSLTKVSNLNKYKLTAYYDETSGVSKQVCMIIAVDK